MSPRREELLASYLYAFPLVFNLEQVARYVATGVGKNPAAQWNTFSPSGRWPVPRTPS